MDNNISYNSFAPVNYYGIGDENNILNTNITSIIEEINSNISVKYTQKDENNRFFNIKSYLLKYLKNDIEELNLIIKDDGTSEIVKIDDIKKR